MIRFSLIGPLRTGSSLLSRCLDDHPNLICLCESEINRALFGEYYVKLHFLRMRKHGLLPVEIVELLDRRKQNSIECYEAWYRRAVVVLMEKYGKAGVAGIGDKSPDFFRTPDLARHVRESHRLIYTIRDPRAIRRSIWADETPEVEKERRWGNFKSNFRFWKDDLLRENVLVVKYESLLSNTEKELEGIFSHIGVENAQTYREAFPRKFPERFLWKGAMSCADNGVVFQSGKSDLWRTELTGEVIRDLEADPEVSEVLERFGYERVG